MIVYSNTNNNQHKPVVYCIAYMLLLSVVLLTMRLYGTPVFAINLNSYQSK